MKRRIVTPGARLRGSILVTSFFLVMLVSVSTLLMSRTLLDQQAANWRRRELGRALYAAEAGISLVQHWSNVAEDFGGTSTIPATGVVPDDPDHDFDDEGSTQPLFYYRPPTEDEIGGTGIVYATGYLKDRFPVLWGVLQSGALTFTEADLDSMTTGGSLVTAGIGAGLGVGMSSLSSGGSINQMTSSNGEDIGKIRELQLWLPGTAGAPTVPAGLSFSTEIVVRSVGRSSNKRLERTVVSYMDINPIAELRLPAGLINSRTGTASVGGNAQIHWGEAWSRESFNMPNKSQMNYVDQTSTPGPPYDGSHYDPWAKWITEGKMYFPTNWQWGVGKDLYNPSSATGAPATSGGRHTPNLGAIGGDTDATDGYNSGGSFKAHGKYEASFFQVAPGTLPWPNLFDQDTYDTLKAFAQENGRYYTTNSSGQILYDGVVVSGGFLDEFEVPTGVDRETEPYDFVFIDTIDQTVPKTDGSNLASISTSGSSNGLKGLYWIGANFTVTGVGDPPSLASAEAPPTDPDDPSTSVSQTLDKIFLDGVLMSPGVVSMAGNAGVYGSVVAGRGFGGTGTPNIWYNHNLRDGMELSRGNVGSRLKNMVINNYSEGQPG